ncbi:hypothetical protein PFISCL1PPCAC_23333, partial [Pristionchus fissidentatus]
MVDKINKKNLSWIAEYNNQASLERTESDPDQIDMNGIDIESEAATIENDSNIHIKEIAKMNLVLPSHFDTRTKWSQCWSVHQIQNQGGCGSCWAAAAVSSMSDRLCISSNYTQQSMLSLQDMISCCEFCGGCQGSSPLEAFIYLKLRGVVTG